MQARLQRQLNIKLGLPDITMKIEQKDIEYIAYLSRIELSENEKETFIHQLSDILSYIETLNRLNTETVEPLSCAINTTNVFREDMLEPSTPLKDALLNAPASQSVFFKVPKVIE
ncbi:aspartyl/glutamyl-tRNA(Asn/Gln) amidotransferase subunit C [Candidatus Brocadia pituitae]|nr:aspartyl/glutamyl-tRNA(Asn/Gln) amidotransferase subunit C [Candidatus Brocadia pituitae]